MDRKVGLESNPTFLSISDPAQDTDPAGTAAGAGSVPDSGSIQNEPPQLDPDGTYVPFPVEQYTESWCFFLQPLYIDCFSSGPRAQF